MHESRYEFSASKLEKAHLGPQILPRKNLSTYWEELLKWKQLISTNVELVSGFERGCLDAFSRFDGKVHLIDGPKDLVDFANGCLDLVSARKADC